MLSDQQIQRFRKSGHLTVLDVFAHQVIANVLSDLNLWSDEFLASLNPVDHGWFLERSPDATDPRRELRKLDNPAFHRAVFNELATDSDLVNMVHQLIGNGVSVFFSQVFMKPPEIGGPKPIHQDNFYFGPDDLDATLTVWIALDDATTENGCLYYSDEHQTKVFPHQAPENEPFNLQVSDKDLGSMTLSPAPVPSGGVSFHHGNTLHQSSANQSEHSRRAVAFHYLRNDARLTHPALPYDESMIVKVS